MANAQGFWSYVHRDDEADSGRIARLARDIVAEYELITGESIELFLDQDQLNWGDDWRGKIDESLSSVAFFIPVLTPRYFQSAECRRELNFFARRANELGIAQLVMPILYADVPALHEEKLNDEAMALVKPFQWEVWANLRFADPASPEYRMAVGRLAKRLSDANEAVAKVDVSAAAAAAAALVEGSDDEELGLFDRMVLAEETMPLWVETVSEIGKQIEAIGSLMQKGTADLGISDQRGQGFAGRLSVLRKIAGELEAPANRISSFGEQFASQMNDVDQGVTIMIERLPPEVREGITEASEMLKFFESIRLMAKASDEGLGALKGMIDSIEPIQKMSRDLRPPLRTLRHGLTVMYEGRQVISSWVSLIGEAEAAFAPSLQPADPSEP
ncbi:hypothetical protein ABH924_001798 [Arthrobacter sp. GAS37]|uniref:TIR domain-containing protein n=1 Tax=Arthrobacter sp. GAS37 TaxID=3156261 RepID=UPI0038378FEF